MEAFLAELLPRLLPVDCTFQTYRFQGKHNLLKNLPNRLRAYKRRLAEDTRVLVVVDRDRQDCLALKQILEGAAAEAHLRTPSTCGTRPWQVINRIAIEELEAWYFGDWEAVRVAYPRVSANVPHQKNFRDPDNIAGGTWEAFERVLKRHNYFLGGLQKIEVARTIAKHIDPARNSSPSFATFCRAVEAALA